MTRPRPKHHTPRQAAQTKRFVAGCQRVEEGPADLKEVAYTELAFPECPTCPHRLIPESGPSFCRWLDADAKNAFAGLESLAQGLS